MHEAARECSYVNPKKVYEILDVTSQTTPFYEKSEYPSGNLTPRQIVRLAAAISADNMATIARGYMNIPSETIENISIKNKDDTDAFKRQILKYWRNKNPKDQVKVNNFVWKKKTSSFTFCKKN